MLKKSSLKVSIHQERWCSYCSITTGQRLLKRDSENCSFVLIAGTVSSIVLCTIQLGITLQKRKIWEARDLPVTAFQKENPTRNLSSVLPAGSVKKAVPYQSISRQSSGISEVRVSRKMPIIF